MKPVSTAVEDRLERFTASEYQCDDRYLESLAGIERLSLSESPFGCSPHATAAAAAELGSLHRYPDASCADLKGELARHYGLDEDWVLVGNGIDELLLVIAQTFAGAGTTAVCNERTYYGHYSALALTAARVDALPLDRAGVSVEPLLDALPNSSLAYVCNPHNPTATALDRDQIDRLAQASETAGCVLVLDEAYAEFADPRQWGSGLAHLDRGNVIVLRSFSKAYGLAGLRCGYALACPELIHRIARARHATPFSVNRVAVAAAQAALHDQEFLHVCVERSRDIREAIRTRLSADGHDVPCSETNFLLIASRGLAQETCTILRDRYRVHARPCDALGFPNHFRLGVTSEPELDKVLAALTEVLPADDMAVA